MTTARNFLADNGLAIRGARGKFSTEAKAFLAKAIAEGKTFEDWDQNGRIKPVHVARVPKSVVPRKSVSVALKPAVRLREENAIKVTTQRGHTIVVDTCQNNHPITRCTCKQILPPKHLQDAVEWGIFKSDFV